MFLEQTTTTYTATTTTTTTTTTAITSGSSGSETGSFISCALNETDCEGRLHQANKALISETIEAGVRTEQLVATYNRTIYRDKLFVKFEFRTHSMQSTETLQRHQYHCLTVLVDPDDV